MHLLKTKEEHYDVPVRSLTLKYLPPRPGQVNMLMLSLDFDNDKVINY